MASGSDTLATARIRVPLRRLPLAMLALGIGTAALTLPLFIGLFRDLWSTEEGAYGPIIVVTAAWLIMRMTPDQAAALPTHGIGAARLLLVGGLAGYLLCARLDMLGPECVCAYAALISIYVSRYGWAALRYAWFPFAYMLLAFPPPETLILPLGQFMKLHLSSAATDLLSALGMPVANTGVVIYVRQYELLVKTACSGLNSLIGLSAVGTFYAYVAHRGRIPLWFALLIPAVAIGCNFVRVLALVTAAYLFGSAVVGTSVHDVIALAMYLVALAVIYLVDLAVGHHSAPAPHVGSPA